MYVIHWTIFLGRALNNSAKCKTMNTIVKYFICLLYSRVNQLESTPLSLNMLYERRWKKLNNILWHMYSFSLVMICYTQIYIRIHMPRHLWGYTVLIAYFQRKRLLFRATLCWFVQRSIFCRARFVYRAMPITAERGP